MNKLPTVTENNTPVVSTNQMMGMNQASMGLRPAIPTTQVTTAVNSTTAESKVLDRRRLQELVKEVDPLEQLDEDVEEVSKQKKQKQKKTKV